MAAGGSILSLLEEATCAICLDYFQDPVLIPECSHNFCRGCLSRSWGSSESQASCPQCRQSFGPRNLLANRQLARMVEEARRCGAARAEDGGGLCPKHLEPLKLFCNDHETLICLVCVRSKQHTYHWMTPPVEALQEYQIKVGNCLKAQKKEKEKIATYKTDTEQTVQEMLDQIKKEKENIVAEFREQQLWLEGQEKLLLARMEETEKEIMRIKEEGLAQHMEDLRYLDSLIREIEEKHQQPASKLLQDIGSILKKYQAKKTYENPMDLLPELKWTVWDYSDITLFLKRAMKKWRDSLETGLHLQKVNVILDQRTAHPRRLNISKDQKSVKGIVPFRAIDPVPNSKRFEQRPYVLGCQKFSTGRHLWEVTVGDTAGWSVGVANKPLNVIDVDEQTSHWEVWESGKQLVAISPSGLSEPIQTEKPTRIRICLNCEGGQVSFFDARTAALLYSFSDASLVGETLLPAFLLYGGACLTLP